MSTQTIGALLARAAHRVDEPAPDRGGQLSVPRPSGPAPFLVTVVPLRGRELRLPMGAPSAAVFLADPETGPKLDSNAIQSVFGLTPAEAKTDPGRGRSRAPTWAFERLGTHRDAVGLALDELTPAAFKTAHAS